MVKHLKPHISQRKTLLAVGEGKGDAKRKKIELIGSTPCLEGLLLEILGRPTHDKSEKCKQQLRVITGKDMFEAEDYIENFQFAHLQNARRNIAEMDKLLRLFEGK